MGCKCDGHYTDNWQRWGVLRRAEAADKSSRLYCRTCRAEWSSRAKYVVLLPDHVKASRGGMTDDRIMRMIEAGRLVVDVETAVVSLPSGRVLMQTEREHRDGPQRGTYRFVNVCDGSRKKKIAVHRLVWMTANGRTVPAGCDVDHAICQDDDSIGNLRLLPSGENRRLGALKAGRNGGAA